MIQAAHDEQLTVMELRQRVKNDRKVLHSKGHASADADAEACQRVIRGLQRLLKDLARVGLEAQHAAVIDACREVQAVWVKNIIRLNGAANEAIASGIKAPKKRSKR